MWIVCLADNSHEIPSFIFSEKVEFFMLHISLALEELSIANGHLSIKL